MISEQTIEKHLQSFEENPDLASSKLDHFKLNFPAIYFGLFSDDQKILFEKEIELYSFIAAVIYACNTKEQGLEFNPEDWDLTLDKNWALMDTTGNVAFDKKLTPFFESSQEEELLAFIEDSLVQDDDLPISRSAQELLFVNLKTAVDLLFS